MLDLTHAAALQMVESGSKGAILMVAKENINSSMLAAGSSPSAPRNLNPKT